MRGANTLSWVVETILLCLAAAEIPTEIHKASPVAEHGPEEENEPPQSSEISYGWQTIMLYRDERVLNLCFHPSQIYLQWIVLGLWLVQNIPDLKSEFLGVAWRETGR